MNALKIIRDIEEAGGKIFLLDSGLKLSAPPGTVTPGMLAKVKSNKAELVSYLGGEKAELVKSAILHPCLLCGGDLFGEGLDDCWHRVANQCEGEPGNALNVPLLIEQLGGNTNPADGQTIKSNS